MPQYPFPCPVEYSEGVCCTGEIQLRAVPGRIECTKAGYGLPSEYKEIPKDFVLPGCDKCGEYFVQDQHEEPLALALESVQGYPTKEECLK